MRRNVRPADRDSRKPRFRRLQLGLASETLRALFLGCALALAAVPASAQEQPESTRPSADPADVASVDAILTALYDVISGPAGPRDWDRFRSLFLPGAMLVPTHGGQGARPVDVEGYVASSGEYFAANPFFEREVARQMEQYGHIAQVFSTYESRHASDDADPFARGINSIQLIEDDGRWWIATITWYQESPENPIPAEYLGSTRTPQRHGS